MTATTEHIRAALALCVDAMRRSAPDYAAAHDQQQTTDEEWDAALLAGEDALDAAADGEETLLEAQLESAA